MYTREIKVVFLYKLIFIYDISNSVYIHLRVCNAALPPPARPTPSVSAVASLSTLFTLANGELNSGRETPVAASDLQVIKNAFYHGT